MIVYEPSCKLTIAFTSGAIITIDVQYYEFSGNYLCLKMPGNSEKGCDTEFIEISNIRKFNERHIFSDDVQDT